MMNKTILKIFFNKQKHEIAFFQSYDKFDNSVFRKVLNTELLKYSLDNIKYDTFQEIVVSFQNICAPLKKKISQSKSCKFCEK